MRVPPVLFILFAGLLACENKATSEKEGIIVDVPAIINKTPEEVVKLLGEPDSAFDQYIVTKKIFTQLYQAGVVEIQYPRGKATDIVIHNPQPLPFEPPTLAAFGVQPKGPTYFQPYEVMRWEDIPEFEMVSFYTVHKADSVTVDNYTIFFKANTDRSQ